MLFQLYFNLIPLLSKFYPDIKDGQASLGNGHFNCCAEMGELMLIYVRDVSWLIKLSLEWQLRNRFLTKFSLKLADSKWLKFEFCVKYITLGGIASICFKFHFQTDYQQTLRYRYRSRGLRGVKRSEKLWGIQNYPLPGRPSTHHWVKSKTIIEKHQKLRKRIINQLLVNFLPPKNIFLFENWIFSPFF